MNVKLISVLNYIFHAFRYLVSYFILHISNNLLIIDFNVRSKIIFGINWFRLYIVFFYF